MDFTSFIHSELTSAWDDKFKFIKSIPDPQVLSMIDLIESYPDLLSLDFLIQNATSPSSIPEEARMALFRMKSLVEVSSNKYQSVKNIKTITKNRLKICKDDNERTKLEETLAEYENLQTPKAKDIRKIFFPVLSYELNTKPNNDGGGCWSFDISIARKDMQLVFDFGGRATFNYFVDVFPKEKPKNTLFLSYESILGFGKPDWELMRLDLLENHVVVFVEVMKRTFNALFTAMKC